MNKAILHGNVGNDPDVKTLQSGNIVAKFSLATNKSYTDKKGEKITDTSWHNIVMWNKLAENTSKWVKKGNSLIIEGEISYRSYENKEGQTVYITEIIGHNMHFTSTKKEEPKPDAKGKITTGSMSSIDDLPQHVRDAEDIPNDEPPFA